MAKYTDYRIMKTSGNRVTFETVKGVKVKVKGSSFEFFKQKKSDILVNAEIGIACGVLNYIESQIDYSNHEIQQALNFFGNINDIPESGKMFISWYWQFAHEFKEIFKFSMPVDVCGLDVIKLDSFIRPKEGESTYDAILKKYGNSAVELIHTIMKTRPYWFYFYNPDYVPFAKS